nr:MAG TPA: hypothetical protein [Caudoviricetes sp.]
MHTTRAKYKRNSTRSAFALSVNGAARKCISKCTLL